MERKDAVLPFVMGSLAFVCFLLAAVFLSAAVQPPWGRIPVLLLPALVLWGIGVLARKGMLSSRTEQHKIMQNAARRSGSGAKGVIRPPAPR